MISKEINVKLIHATPLKVCSVAIRTCWDSHNKSDNGGEKDRALIDRIGNKMKHESVKNHLNFTFFISNISTKTLLALTRHDIGTEFSVQSTRYTCKKNELSYAMTNNEFVNQQLERIINIINETMKHGASCDDIAMLLPQSYQYSLVATFSLTAIQHFWKLRDSKDAHYDIRNLSDKLWQEFPEDYKYLREKEL